MTLKKVDAFSPAETKTIEGRQLTDVEVASAYHIAPELVGAREGNYSNVEAFRQMLYRDGLGPMFVAWEQVINSMLVQDFNADGDLYVEADIDAKLRGSFEEQAKVLSTATGGPYLLRAEARARMNLPEIEGADELIVPLNVVVGGQASPQDSGTQNET
jgi:phage portal protein BeeE